MGEKQHNKCIAAYIGGAKKKIVVDIRTPDLKPSLKYQSHYKREVASLTCHPMISESMKRKCRRLLTVKDLFIDFLLKLEVVLTHQ